VLVAGHIESREPEYGTSSPWRAGRFVPLTNVPAPTPRNLNG